MNLDILSGGGDLGLSLYNNKASHHKSRKLLFSASKLISAKKRKKAKTNYGRNQADFS